MFTNINSETIEKATIRCGSLNPVQQLFLFFFAPSFHDIKNNTNQFQTLLVNPKIKQAGIIAQQISHFASL